MKKLSLLVPVLGILLSVACGGRTTQGVPQSTLVEPHEASGDSTIYGLACDGCNDTILVLLRDVAADPDTLNILNATRSHRVFGQPSIGDKLAVVRSAERPDEADIVIDMASLRGKWCYLVKPTLRRRADMPEMSVEQLIKMMPDSVRQALFVPREYGFQITGEGSVRPVGVVRQALTSDEESVVDYPVQRRYRDWRIFNGRLVFSEVRTDSLGVRHITQSDTAELVMLRPDSLVLRFKDGVQNYYLSTEE